ncbi:hypothetical protein PAMP_006752 [Pampus punctatissimus]
MLLNSSSVQKQNYSLRVLRKTLTPGRGDAYLRLRTFSTGQQIKPPAFSEEVKRIQQLEEKNGGCALKKKNNKKQHPTFRKRQRPLLLPLSTERRTRHTHLDKLGHEVGPQCVE